jgi:hypothetical protein
MKKGLPKFMLLTDPYNGIEGRILIFKTEYPRYIFELNRPEDPESETINLHGIDYSILMRKNLDDKELRFGILKEVVRWFHYSLISKNEPKTDI